MTTEKVKNEVEHSSIGEGVKNTANNAISQIKDKTGDILSEQKNQFSVSLKNIAHSLRETSKNLEKTDEKAACNTVFYVASPGSYVSACK